MSKGEASAPVPPHPPLDPLLYNTGSKPIKHLIDLVDDV